jgi:hypothetical protein
MTCIKWLLILHLGRLPCVATGSLNVSLYYNATCAWDLNFNYNTVICILYCIWKWNVFGADRKVIVCISPCLVWSSLFSSVSCFSTDVEFYGTYNRLGTHAFTIQLCLSFSFSFSCIVNWDDEWRLGWEGWGQPFICDDLRRDEGVWHKVNSKF